LNQSENTNIGPIKEINKMQKIHSTSDKYLIGIGGHFLILKRNKAFSILFLAAETVVGCF
jgi:hypothetical protein